MDSREMDSLLSQARAVKIWPNINNGSWKGTGDDQEDDDDGIEREQAETERVFRAREITVSE